MEDIEIKKILITSLFLFLLLIVGIGIVIVLKQDESEIQKTFRNEYPEYNIIQIKKGLKNNGINYVIACENKKTLSRSNIAICYNSDIYILELAKDDKSFYFSDNPIKEVGKDYVTAMLYSDNNKKLIPFNIEVTKNNKDVNFKISTK